jgi:ribosome-binding protein aMBF1 (putative translation factor)
MGRKVDDYATEVEARADDVQRGILDVYTEHFDAERRRLFDVPRQLTAAREAVHMTQRQLAEACGIHQSEISRIERGQISPTLDTLTRLMAPLGVRLTIVDAHGRPLPA